MDRLGCRRSKCRSRRMGMAAQREIRRRLNRRLRRRVAQIEFAPGHTRSRHGWNWRRSVLGPDSKSVAFTVGSQLRKVRLPDGAAEAIVLLPGLNRGGAWSQNGTILIAAADSGVWGLYVLPAGGSLRRVP